VIQKQHGPDFASPHGRVNRRSAVARRVVMSQGLTMPLPNRVTPFGTLEPSPARGLFMGNRGGRFHDAASGSVPGRPWTGRRWLICTCDFKGSAAAFRAAGRAVWDGGRYTELFFSDEVTALASGHRPCIECRRPDALAFRRAAAAGGAFAAMPSCDALDRALDAERREGRAQRRHAIPFATLPEGAMVALEGAAFALRHGQLLPWRHDGYGPPRALPDGLADCLTPPTTLAALRGGYRPVWRGP
jgi:hypothetical protein